jgi:hypothetical protein
MITRLQWIPLISSVVIGVCLINLAYWWATVVN